MVTVEKVSLSALPVRPRTDEAIIVTRDNGDRIRYEFDYDDNNIYVYTSVWPFGWPIGIGCERYLPIRAYRRRTTSTESE